MTAGIGHNGGPEHPDVLNSAAQNQIRSIIQRVERLVVEKEEVLELIKEVFDEAKGNGFDVKVLRKVLAIRRQDRAKREEAEMVLGLYLVATGDAVAFEPASGPAPQAAEEDDLA